MNATCYGAYEVIYKGQRFIHCATPQQIKNLFIGCIIVEPPNRPDQCKGYIGTMHDGSTFFHDGRNVYRAAVGNVVDCNTGYLHGRYECSIGLWDKNMHDTYNMPGVTK